MTTEKDITRLLAGWEEGDPASQQALLQAVFPDLKKIGANMLARQGGRPALQTTELVNEAYLRLIGQRNQSWANRGHFFSIIARIMRRVIIDLQRNQRSMKRGGDQVALDVDLMDIPVPAHYPDWVELDRAVRELTEIHPDAARVADLRHTLGMSLEETAEALGIGTATVGRYWRFARAWLATRLKDHGPVTPPE